MLFEITSAALDAQRLIDHVRKDESGAVALFSGVVRNENLGRRVLYLEYDAYPDMAERVMREIAGEALGQWPITDVAMQHPRHDQHHRARRYIHLAGPVRGFGLPHHRKRRRIEAQRLVDHRARFDQMRQ